MNKLSTLMLADLMNTEFNVKLQRRDLLGQLGDLPGIDIVSLDSETICELLLFGSPNLNVIVNRIILEATISFIKSTQRLG